MLYAAQAYYVRHKSLAFALQVPRVIFISNIFVLQGGHRPRVSFHVSPIGPARRDAPPECFIPYGTAGEVLPDRQFAQTIEGSRCLIPIRFFEKREQDSYFRRNSEVPGISRIDVKYGLDERGMKLNGRVECAHSVIDGVDGLQRALSTVPHCSGLPMTLGTPLGQAKVAQRR
ncbi:MAG: hypothetical protein V4696_08040 [Pseudomonadota bacterium]